MSVFFFFLLIYFHGIAFPKKILWESKRVRGRRTYRVQQTRMASCSIVEGSIKYAWLCVYRTYSRETGLVTDRKRDEGIGLVGKVKQEDRKE